MEEHRGTTDTARPHPIQLQLEVAGVRDGENQGFEGLGAVCGEDRMKMFSRLQLQSVGTSGSSPLRCESIPVLLTYTRNFSLAFFHLNLQECWAKMK